MKVEQNISRLNYLLQLYRLTVNDFIDLISKGLTKKPSKDEIFTSEININYLKRIDKVFNKGIYYYLDPEDPTISNDSSIFFRKGEFETDLNLGAKQVVNHFEELKNYFSGISRLSDINTDRLLPFYTVDSKPKEVAFDLRKKIYPEFNFNKRDFLKALISKFAEYNILVFEFIETHNKKNKANIDGLYLSPNVIVVKRHQLAFRREIFTLVHELGHYLLSEEEIEELDISHVPNTINNKIERWCNDFTYYFLVGEFESTVNSLSNANASNDYHHSTIANVSNYTHLSRIALFTRLLIEEKIKPSAYKLVKEDFDAQFNKNLDLRKAKQALDKADGKQGGSVPKAIISPLFESTIKTAFYEGVISEYDMQKLLKTPPPTEDNNKYID